MAPPQLSLHTLLDFCELSGPDAGTLSVHFGMQPFVRRGDSRIVIPKHSAPRYLFLLDMLGYQDINGADYGAVREPSARVEVWADPFIAYFVQGGETHGGYPPYCEVAVVHQQSGGRGRFHTGYFAPVPLLGDPNNLTAQSVTESDAYQIIDSIRTKSRHGFRFTAPDLDALDFSTS